MTDYDWLTTAEVGAEIRMSPEYVARLCERKALRAKKLGREWRIHKDSLAAFMGANDKAPATRNRRRAS